MIDGLNIVTASQGPPATGGHEHPRGRHGRGHDRLAESGADCGTQDYARRRALDRSDLPGAVAAAGRARCRRRRRRRRSSICAGGRHPLRSRRGRAAHAVVPAAAERQTRPTSLSHAQPLAPETHAAATLHAHVRRRHVDRRRPGAGRGDAGAEQERARLHAAPTWRACARWCPPARPPSWTSTASRSGSWRTAFAGLTLGPPQQPAPPPAMPETFASDRRAALRATWAPTGGSKLSGVDYYDPTEPDEPPAPAAGAAAAAMMQAAFRATWRAWARSCGRRAPTGSCSRARSRARRWPIGRRRRRRSTRRRTRPTRRPWPGSRRSTSGTRSRRRRPAAVRRRPPTSTATRCSTTPWSSI